MNNQRCGTLNFANICTDLLSNELNPSLICTDLLSNAWDSIPEIPDSTSPLPVTFKVSNSSSEKDAMIIAFASSPAVSTLRNLRGEENGNGLVDSSDAAFPLFEFVCTEVYPSVSINRAAIQQFASLQDKLSALKDEIDVKRPLIITGLSLGGSIASLFTLWLLRIIYLKKSIFPLCITFVSPLLGDDAFVGAILARPMWISCFLHVIFNQDPVPKYLVSLGHMPFGTTLFLSESGFACFEEPESVFELLKSTSLRMQDSQIVDYGGILKRVKYNAIVRGIIEEVDRCHMTNPLEVGITLQLKAIGVIEEENVETSALIQKIEKEFMSFQRRERNVFRESKKLTEINIYMACLEWYNKLSKDRGGYYDCYKSARTKSGNEEIVRYQRISNRYWKHMVDAMEQMPKSEIASMFSQWLSAGTYFRRMVEPLDIAEYYGRGKRDYINVGRARHYKLLEQWEKYSSSSKPAERANVSSLTVDSCFWAHVEEAIIVSKLLKDGDDSNRLSLIESLVEFERYVLGLMRNLLISPETFHEESSFMKLWNDIIYNI